MTTKHLTDRRLRRRLSAIRQVAERSFDVADLEPLLVELLDFLRSDETDRATAERVFAAVAEDWPPGSVEALEFAMRELQWPAVKSALERQAESDADFRARDQARRVLEVFEPEWPAGEIYATYR